MIVGGLDWAFDLSGLASARLAGHNIVYATHLYPFATKMPEHWDGAFGFMRQDVPLLIAEFAPGSTDNPLDAVTPFGALIQAALGR